MHIESFNNKKFNIYLLIANLNRVYENHCHKNISQLTCNRWVQSKTIFADNEGTFFFLFNSSLKLLATAIYPRHFWQEIHIWARGYKTFIMLNSIEHEIINTHKYKKYQGNSNFLGSDKPRMLFFQLVNVKMPTIVGILTFLSRKNFVLSWVEHEKSFITSGPGFQVTCPKMFSW